MNYTKGEWEAVMGINKRIEVVVETDKVLQEKQIAQLFPRRTDEEMLANANLIAAAPDLYEACKGLIEIAEMAMPTSFFQSDSRVELAQQALAKAAMLKNKEVK